MQLIECPLCNEQYVGKTKIAGNLRLHNQVKDVKNSSTILACKQLQN